MSWPAAPPLCLYVLADGAYATERHVALSFVACSLTTLLLVVRDDQQTVGETCGEPAEPMRRALQGAALPAWILSLMGKSALRRKPGALARLRHPLLQEMAGVWASWRGVEVKDCHVIYIAEALNSMPKPMLAINNIGLAEKGLAA